ncbi:MAG: Asp-tRNA(Asn)/Glu-tRNA(Gln) amidotransferase subunit GatB [Elusimicrobia bacterium]|nr:Asp-tRNA(Asn)/Glu-tRNA(Gln) amidotransferase subunit GatB [Elusimicrobiota bacterium]
MILAKPGYLPTIGLEVHIQLATRSKLFCSCSAKVFGEPPNSSICPVCTGQPGALPVLNAGAVELALRAALALQCQVHPTSVFARKNYFYPDLPKNYQISQYESPLAEKGLWEIPGSPTKKIRITRLHLEEDAGKLLHTVGREALEYSLVDFNRSGIPLIEIVSEPDLTGAEEAFRYLTALKSAMQYLEVSRCDMEKGELRCDVNLSVSESSSRLGTKVEIKNLNSFRSVKDAIQHEIERQSQMLRTGARILQETRLWNAQGGLTESMRSKEEAHDYRYFPDPDLPPLQLNPKKIEEVRSSLPELPASRKNRLQTEYLLSEPEAQVLTLTKPLADFFERGAQHLKAPAPKAPDHSTLVRDFSNSLVNELLGKLHAENLEIESSPVGPEFLAALILLRTERNLPQKIIKDILEAAFQKKEKALLQEDPATARKTAEAWIQNVGIISDSNSLTPLIRQALFENHQAAEDFRAGKEQALSALVGSVMKKTSGKANPQQVNQLLREALGKK